MSEESSKLRKAIDDELNKAAEEDNLLRKVNGKFHSQWNNNPNF
jgi:hypothetical protein